MSDDAIKERFNSIDKSVEIHEKRISNLEKTYAVMEKMEYRMDQIEKSITGIDKKLDEQTETIEKQGQEIEILKGELLDIEKPFKNMPDWLAKAINWIINLFK